MGKAEALSGRGIVTFRLALLDIDVVYVCEPGLIESGRLTDVTFRENKESCLCENRIGSCK